MECLRKAEEKSKESENRMPSIVEAGALAVATTVKPHSLTSNNDITPIASFPKECLIEESFYRLPVSQKPPRRVNTVIQHNLERNRLLVLMILFATSGFVMWNGEEWRALWVKKKKEKEEDEKDEKTLLDLLKSDYKKGYEFYQKKLAPSQEKFAKEYDQKLKGIGFYEKDKLLPSFSVDNFKSILDTLSEWRTSLKPYLRPFFFFDDLTLIEMLWKLYVIKKNKKFLDRGSTDQFNFELDDSNCDMAKHILSFMQEFSREYPKFSNSNDYVEFKEEYNVFLRETNNWSISWDADGIGQNYVIPPSDVKLNVLTLWEKEMGWKK